MTFGKRVPENQRAKPNQASPNQESPKQASLKKASNDIPARYWVPVLGAISIGIGLVVVSRVVANTPPDAPVAVATEQLNK